MVFCLKFSPSLNNVNEACNLVCIYCVFVAVPSPLYLSSLLAMLLPFLDVSEGSHRSHKRVEDAKF